MLRIRDLGVRYGDVTAVQDVDLDLAPAETLALLGRSGSGKTTVLKAIAGLVEPAAGSIMLDGEDLTSVPTHRRRIGLVFQDFALFPHLDVGDNVAYGLRMQGLPQSDQRVAAALTMVGLNGLQRRRIDQLSGGQAQRVALARTLAPRPRLLLLDEPLGSLDPDLRSSVASELKALLDDTGIPTIVVTHDTAEAFSFGDRLAILVDGRVAREGEADAVWADPKSTHVARLLGHRSIVSALVNARVATVGDVRIPVDVADGPVALLLRPGATSSPGPVRVEVIDSRYRGPDWLITVALGEGTVEVASTRQHRPSETVTIDIDPAQVIALD